MVGGGRSELKIDPGGRAGKSHFLNLNIIMKTRRKKELGFTLIELLVVVAIIGVLATMVMTSLNVARSKARDARRVSDVHQIQLALQLYYNSKGRYPADLSDLMPTYINAMPLDPDGISEYQYCVTLSGTNFHLGTREAGLEIPDSSALLSDADVESDGCSGGNSFSGEDPVFDVKP